MCRHSYSSGENIFDPVNSLSFLPVQNPARRFTRVWHGAMLTTCPNCLHVFHNNNNNNRVVLHPVVSTAPSCCETNRQQLLHQQQQQPLLVSLTLPPTSVATTCTVSVTTSSCQQHGLSTSQRVLAGMAGGGIVVSNNNNNNPSSSTSSSVILQQHQQQGDEKAVSPSTPLSFVLPSVFLMPTATNANSDTDLVRLAATLKALRTSGWYYEGLSWQESAELLQSTAPGTFLVRDSSDPKFLFSLSVQTERGPTSVRLHYVCGQFRLDAEARLAPLMPLFECVVRLVEYYIEATRNSIDKGSHLRHKEQVWVDARGHMYSHILLTTPLYKKQHLPSLQHLARLSINASLKAGGPAKPVTAAQLSLPTLLTDYLKEYPYSH
ncbi:hypothetical protein C0J52_03175 [Blattella germanica]|nr:hypothetical protein C0J52_03175 [Blattella germanica]